MAEEITTAPEPKNVSEKDSGAVEELPKSIVRRLVKEKLSEHGEISVLREAVEAFSESSRIFIHYLSAALVSSSWLLLDLLNISISWYILSRHS